MTIFNKTFYVFQASFLVKLWLMSHFPKLYRALMIKKNPKGFHLTLSFRIITYPQATTNGKKTYFNRRNQARQNPALWLPGIWSYDMKTLAPEACISGRDKWLHPTVFCGMQLLIPAWESLYIGCLVATGRLAKNGASAGYFQERYISLNFLLNSSELCYPGVWGILTLQRAVS